MKFKFLKSIFLTLILSSSCLINVANAGLITTVAGANSSFTCLGTDSGCGNLFGQSFTVGPSENLLQSLGFEFTNVNGDGLLVQLEIWNWSGSNTVGSSIWQSSIDTLSTGTSGLFSWNTNLSLIAGNQYAATVNTLLSGNTTSDKSGFFVGSDSLYTQGTFFWKRNYGDLSINNFSLDAGFQANFSATDVPEPSTLAIFALGMIGLASRRFKKQS